MSMFVNRCSVIYAANLSKMFNLIRNCKTRQIQVKDLPNSGRAHFSLKSPAKSNTSSSNPNAVKNNTTPNPPNSTKPLPKEETQPQTPLEKVTLFSRFKAMYKDYYYVLVPVHLVTSIGWFGGFYQTSKSGMDIGGYMKKLGFSDSIVSKITNSGMGHFAVAYALYKIATPVRYTVTLGSTTWAINRLQKLGLIKPAKEIISKGKERLLAEKGKFKSK